MLWDRVQGTLAPLQVTVEAAVQPGTAVHVVLPVLEAVLAGDSAGVDEVVVAGADEYSLTLLRKGKPEGRAHDS